MAGMIPYWNGLGKQPICTLEGKPIILLYLLRLKTYVGRLVVTQGDLVSYLGPNVLLAGNEPESSDENALDEVLPEAV